MASAAAAACVLPPVPFERTEGNQNFWSSLDIITSEYQRLCSENAILRAQLLDPPSDCRKLVKFEDEEREPPRPSMAAFQDVPCLNISAVDGPVDALQEEISAATKDGKVRIETPTYINQGTTGLGNLQENLQQGLADRKAYDIRNYYHTTGIAQAIARHYLFDRLTMLLIVLNAIWIAIDTDYNQSDLITKSSPLFQAIEEAFTIFFFLELSIRFLAFKAKLAILGDYWFVFDFLMVLLMVIDNWVIAIVFLATSSSSSTSRISNITIVRLLRLLRLVRLLRNWRVVTFCPEIFILVKAITVAARCVALTIVLLICVIYVFSIAFTQLLRGTDSGQLYFPTVLYSFNTLIFKGPILDSPTELSSALLQDSLLAYLVYICFVLLSSVTIMNMLIGVLVSAVSEIGQAEKEAIQIDHVREVLRDAFSLTDFNHDNMVEDTEFLALLQNESAVFALEDLGIDVASIHELPHLIFGSQSKLSLKDITSKLLLLRRSNPATVMDFIELRKWFALMSQSNKQK